MPFIIDGHNLIGQLPTIALDDPDDEAKLVQLLQRYAMRHRVSMTVFFDRGTYGQSRLGGNGVSVSFARSPEDADRRIMRHMRRLSQPQQWTLVSADAQLASAALAAGLRVVDTREFAGRLQALDAPPPGADERAAADAHVKGGQIDEWLDLFGVSAEEAERPIDLVGRRGKRRETTQPSRQRQDKTPSEPSRSRGRSRRLQDQQGRRLIKPPPPSDPDEVEEWLRLFGVEDEDQE